MLKNIALSIFLLLFAGCSTVQKVKPIELTKQKALVEINDRVQKDLKKSVYKSEKIGLYLNGDYSHPLTWLYGLNFYIDKNLLEMKNFTNSSLLEPGFGLKTVMPMYFSNIFNVKLEKLEKLSNKKSFNSFIDLYKFYYNKYYKASDSFAYYELKQDLKNEDEFIKCVNGKNYLEKKYLSYINNTPLNKESLTINGEVISKYDFTYDWFIMCLIDNNLGEGNGN